MEKHNSFSESLERTRGNNTFFLIWIKKICKLSSPTETQYEFRKTKVKAGPRILTNFEDTWDEDFAIYPEDGASLMSADVGLFHPQAQSSVTYRMK